MFAHTGSRLQLKGIVPSLPEGMILFPFARGVMNTTADVPIQQETVTLRKDEKKFFGSVAVESATTNYWTSVGLTGSGCSILENSPDKNNYLKVEITSTTTSFIAQSHISIPSTLATLSFKCRVINRPSVVLEAYLSGRNSAVDTSSPVTVGQDWVTITYTQTMNINSSFNRSCFYMRDSASYNGAIIEFKDFQVEPLDHATSFVKGSRPAGHLAYDISHLGMSSKGCISFWVLNSDVMFNHKAGGGVTSNQYLLTARFGPSAQTSDLITIRINSSNRLIHFWSSSSSSEEHTIGPPITNYPQGEWLHFVIQWDKDGLPSGNRKEMYINGELVASSSSQLLPDNILHFLHVGQWAPSSNLIPSTLFEQLAIHPSKGFSADEIRNWYTANAPFYDFRDTMIRW